jgi:predicted HicB family RNase H-like nuclease
MSLTDQKQPRRRLQVRVNPEIADALEDMAREQQRSVNNLAALLLTQAVAARPVLPVRADVLSLRA